MTLAVLVAVSLLLFLAEALGEVADGRLLASTLFESLLLRLPSARPSCWLIEAQVLRLTTALLILVISPSSSSGKLR